MPSFYSSPLFFKCVSAFVIREARQAEGYSGRRLQPYRSAESQRLCPSIGQEGFVVSIDGGLPSDVVFCDFRGRRSRVQQIGGDAARQGRAVQRAQVSPCSSKHAADRNVEFIRVNALTKTEASGCVARQRRTNPRGHVTVMRGKSQVCYTLGPLWIITLRHIPSMLSVDFMLWLIDVCWCNITLSYKQFIHLPCPILSQFRARWNLKVRPVIRQCEMNEWMWKSHLSISIFWPLSNPLRHHDKKTLKLEVCCLL